MTESKQSDTPIYSSDGIELKVIYLECHINIEPSDKREELEQIASRENFKLAKLTMDKELTRDMFMTGHARPDSVTTLTLRMLRLSDYLKAAGFNVLRSKIEAVIYDTRKYDVRN